MAMATSSTLRRYAGRLPPGVQAIDYEDISNSEFLVIQLAVNARRKFFVAQVVNVVQTPRGKTLQLEVLFLKQSGRFTYCFPVQDDRSDIVPNQVVGKVTMTPDRRGTMFTTSPSLPSADDDK
jgi:hypothetical protein